MKKLNILLFAILAFTFLTACTSHEYKYTENIKFKKELTPEEVSDLINYDFPSKTTVSNDYFSISLHIDETYEWTPEEKTIIYYTAFNSEIKINQADKVFPEISINMDLKQKSSIKGDDPKDGGTFLYRCTIIVKRGIVYVDTYYKPYIETDYSRAHPTTKKAYPFKDIKYEKESEIRPYLSILKRFSPNIEKILKPNYGGVNYNGFSYLLRLVPDTINSSLNVEENQSTLVSFPTNSKNITYKMGYDKKDNLIIETKTKGLNDRYDRFVYKDGAMIYGKIIREEKGITADKVGYTLSAHFNYDKNKIKTPDLSKYDTDGFI